MKEHRPSAEIEKELKAAQSRRALLLKDAAALKEQVKALEAEADTLCRNEFYHSHGVIPKLKEELASAKTWERHQSCLPVAWAKASYLGDRKYIVDKVTLKRIFVCEVGHSSSTQYLLDGTSPGRYQGDAIDIRKTFNIDADSVPPGWNGEGK